MPSQPDYIAQFRAELVQYLPTRSTREKDAFAALDMPEQAWRFMNWLSRGVHPHPRQINKARDFDDLPSVRANKPRVEVLLASLARGDDVNTHLSRDVGQGYCLHPPDRKDGPDFDLLLNEWGIHHLHLSQESGSGGFRARSKELLYLILGRGAAFVLAVAPHGAWTNRQLVEAAVSSWPDQGLFVALGVHPGRDNSEGDHKRLRKAGMTTSANFNGRCWISGVTLGISTALVSNRVAREAYRLVQSICRAVENPENLRRQLMNAAIFEGLVWPQDPDIRIRFLSVPDRYCFVFKEEISGAMIFL